LEFQFGAAARPYRQAGGLRRQGLDRRDGNLLVRLTIAAIIPAARHGAWHRRDGGGFSSGLYRLLAKLLSAVYQGADHASRPPLRSQRFDPDSRYKTLS
jgi:hypothetical protein